MNWLKIVLKYYHELPIAELNILSNNKGLSFLHAIKILFHITGKIYKIDTHSHRARSFSRNYSFHFISHSVV